MSRHHVLMRRVSVWLLSGLLGASSVAGALGHGEAAAAAGGMGGGYPPEDAGYHDFTELQAELQQVAADHPALVRLSTIGTTARGRDLLMIKISDRPDVDEGEPEVLFDALHHAREHLTPEMALWIVHRLTDDYATDQRIREIVDSRVIWVIPMVNPDGLQFDLGGDPYRGWRKNRQSNGDGVAIGTDLNRNYSYRWGWPGASASPAGDTYRGAAPLSAPEAAAMRDFIVGRVVDGRQRIRAHITFHSTGEVIHYPYGHTLVDVPADMTKVDHRTFVALADAMAETNGYTAAQSSDTYLKSGTLIDWAYARQRMFSFTFELYPQTDVGLDRFYPPDELIGQETARNGEAVLFLLEQADCPYRAIGKVAALCGPFFDDLEIDRGWTVDPDGSDTATAGAWQRGDPEATFADGPKQLGTAASGRAAFVTGRKMLGCATCNDVDGGTSRVRSPVVLLPAGPPATLHLRWAMGHDATAGPDDGLRVAVMVGGQRFEVLAFPGTSLDRDAEWRTAQADLSAWAGSAISIQLEATDVGSPSLLEAAFDQVRITAP